MIRSAAAAGVTALLAAGLLWSVGFTGFSREARSAGETPPEADGIVALTGGADRIETALRLLADGRAPRLLVSGVGRGGDLGAVVKRSPSDAALPSDRLTGERITLGHDATSTLGNAAETAAWAQAHGVRRLIVVTAGYHMRRALFELGRNMPGVVFFPVPVQSPALRRTDLATTRLLANEYDKFLAVRLGVAQRKGEEAP